MPEIKKYLFLFTIGPVQSFIAQARKTQDLYAGSQLLADLVNCALSYIKTMHKNNNPVILYPFYNKTGNNLCTNLPKNEDSYPNRIMLEIAFESERKAETFGKCIENIIKESFLSTAEWHIEEVIALKDIPLGINEQLNSFLEVYWVGMPYDKEKDTYKAKFKELERNLASVKNFRQIKQLSETEKGRKCNVDGEYNVKFYRKSETEAKHTLEALRTKKLFSKDNFIISPDYRDIKLRHIQPGEGLSAISFFKRLYRSKEDHHQNFPSTAAIATLNLKDEISELENCFDKDCYDEQLLFEDNLNQKYFSKQFIEPSKQLMKLKPAAFLKYVKTVHRKLVNTVKAKNLTFTKYYALIRFDGDSIGSKIAKAISVEQHQKFSELLINFAKKATKVLDGDEYTTFRTEDVCIGSIPVTDRGRTIYAGGDDFIGFVCLDYLFDTIKHLQYLYKTEVNDKAQKIFEDEDDYTLSIGVVIAHYKTPLNEVVKTSKALEKNAKEFRKEKNCTGLSFMTTSTTLAETYFPNEYWEALSLLTEHLKKKDLSSKFIFLFAREMALLDTTYKWDIYSTLFAAQKNELRRLMYRASTNEFRKKEEFGELYKSMSTFFKENVKENTSKKRQIMLSNFVSFLKVADKLSSKLKIQENEAILENTPV